MLDFFLAMVHLPARVLGGGALSAESAPSTVDFDTHLLTIGGWDDSGHSYIDIGSITESDGDHRIVSVVTRPHDRADTGQSRLSTGGTLLQVQLLGTQNEQIPRR